MRALGALDRRFADEHVPLAVLLGALGGLSAVRRLLPARPGDGATANEGDAPAAPPEPFVALLLGVLVTHDRLTHLLGPALGEPTPAEASGSGAGGEPQHLGDSLLR